MNVFWIYIASFFIVRNVYSVDVCKQVTTFDALCKKDDILYILSANPCKSKNSISVTIISMKNASYYSHAVIEADTEDPIPIWNRPGAGAVVIMHLQPASDDVRDHRKARLDVMLYLVDIKKFKENAKWREMILEAKFPMFTKQCSTNSKKSEPINHASCRHAHSLGEFSSLCIILRKSPVTNSRDLDRNPGVYMIFTDVCTVPYSTTIVTLLFSGHIVNETFTQDKTDKYIPTNVSQPKCGLLLHMHGHYGEHLHVLLKYGCRGDNVTIINAIYHTHTGMICPLSACSSTPSPKALQQGCKIPWIYSKDKTVEAHVEVILNICHLPFSIWWNIHIYEKKQIHNFPFEEHEQLKIGDMTPFHLGHPKIMHDPVSTTNGYMYLDWGKVSLFIRQTDSVYVSVLRHYPFNNDTIPLFRTEFWLKDVDKKKICPPKDKSLTTGLTIAGIGIVILIIIVAVILYRRGGRWRKAKGVGLPYQIQLGEEIALDPEMYEDS